MTAWAPPLLYQAQSGTGNAGGHGAVVLRDTQKVTLKVHSYPWTSHSISWTHTTDPKMLRGPHKKSLNYMHNN